MMKSFSGSSREVNVGGDEKGGMSKIGEDAPFVSLNPTRIPWSVRPLGDVIGSRHRAFSKYRWLKNDCGWMYLSCGTAKVNHQKFMLKSQEICRYMFTSVLVSNQIVLRSSVPNKCRFLPRILSRDNIRGLSKSVVEGLFPIARSATLVVKLRPSKTIRESWRESAPR